MPSVFVLMPFGEEFDPVFSGFIKPVLEQQGFDVARADTVKTLQSIVKDIVERIGGADLIVADLTDSEPNVYYEVGIAHALDKPVILLTQSIESVRFDVNHNRLMEYSTHFDKIDKAKEGLAGYAKMFLHGGLVSSNQVSDLYQIIWRDPPSPAIVPSDDPEPEDSGDMDEPGFFDHMTEVNESYIRIGEIVESQTTCVGQVGECLQDATKALESINPNNQSSPSAFRSILRRLAEQLAPLNGEIESGNAEFSAIMDKTEDSLEFVLSFTVEHGDLTDPNLTGLIGMLKSLRESAQQAREGCATLKSAVDGSPRFERRLNRESYRLSQAMAVIDDNFSRVIASISRALDKLPLETIEGSP